MLKQDGAGDFVELAKQAQPSLLREYWEFLRYTRKWWIAVIVSMLLLMSLFVLLSGSAVAPFIYPLF